MANLIERQLADALIRQYDTRDPFELCRELHISVETKDLGSLRGMYTVIRSTRFIVIGSICSPPMRKIICAHELGHDQLHREIAASRVFHDNHIYAMRSKPEYEANLFAAALLLPAEEVYDYIGQGYNVAQIAALMETDPNLLWMRLHLMIQEGYHLHASSLEMPRADFLRG